MGFGSCLINLKQCQKCIYKLISNNYHPKLYKLVPEKNVLKINDSRNIVLILGVRVGLVSI